MSWAIYAMRGPGGVRRLDEIPEGYAPPSLGTADEVVAMVREVVPAVDATKKSWLVLRSDDYDVELSIGKGVDVHDVTFYLNDGPRSIPVVMEISRRLGATPYDTESGDFLTEESRPPVPPPLTEEEIKANKPKWWKFGRA
ncbi:hypothetical protein Kfla_1183 [Kribbella flavida DSM 17836]|uniref:Uncharacterized protein n=1 Tax=Kribbella flavida (strain DSM 17836 / JCM 10339 / NBRC 14399) TaxID=479435 RepID=D2Q2V5_KRIFD|nr:hypothetical protein [Kribbella flavida]ADB30286.1 hypothetical protein Kfla_1183 [Kribbella flavida DSM 17836]